MNLVIQVSKFMRPYINEISLALIASILTIYGNHLFFIVKKTVSKFHFTLRTLVFVLMCSAGLPAITLYSHRTIKYFLFQMDNLWLFPSTLALFILLGVLAEKHNLL